MMHDSISFHRLCHALKYEFALVFRNSSYKTLVLNVSLSLRPNTRTELYLPIDVVFNLFWATVSNMSHVH